jgi:hypothetical protein
MPETPPATGAGRSEANAPMSRCPRTSCGNFVAQQPASDLLSSTEVAARLCVHPRSVAQLVRAGDQAATSVGRGLCSRVADVEDYRRRDAAALDAYVMELVAEAPPLTDRQRARLAALLQPSSEAR